MYKDIEEKIKFYKQQTIQSFIKKGIYPDNKLIAEQLSNIDSTITILSHKNTTEGDYFDAKQYNKEIEAIYKDLEILYKILYELTITEFIEIKAFADSHLKDLENTSETYKAKAELEINSSSLGNTLLFKYGSFESTVKNNTKKINLGPLRLNQGSIISCIVNAHNVPAENIIFNVEKGEEIIKANAFNYNGDQITIPGNINIETYVTTVPADKQNSGPVKMDIGDNKATLVNKYSIFAAKKHVLLRTYANQSQEIISFGASNIIELPSRGYIDFYVIGGSSITFKFNKKPLSTNFPLDNYVVSNLNRIHHFVIEGDAGFALSFGIDKGECFAIKDNGVIMDDELYFSKIAGIKEFYVEQYTPGDIVIYDAYVTITDADESLEVESIMVKELVKLEGL
jgi:transposase